MAPTPESLPAPATPPEIVSKFKEILKSNGINDPVAEVILKDSGLKGENMASLTEYVTVIFENPGRKPLHLFVKKPTKNEAYNKMLDDWQLFQKEAMFFMEYLPVARDYCKSMGQEELMKLYPKCYYGDDKLVVLENLVLNQGNILLDKLEQQDFETAKVSVTNLAKHHAISHAVIKKLGGPKPFFERFAKLKYEALISDATKDMLTPSLDGAIDNNVKILEKCNVDGKEEAIEKLTSMKGKQFDEITESLEAREDEFLVLNHGDYWNNNMMFLKDKETGEITDHILIDFQVIRYVSPCADLGYYAFTSLKPEVRKTQLRELLAVYLEALKVTANELGHPIELSQQKLEADFCKHFHYGFWFGLMTSGAGFAVLKDMEINETDGIEDWTAKFDKLVVKWIEDNPEKLATNAENTIQSVKQYVRLGSGIFME